MMATFLLTLLSSMLLLGSTTVAQNTLHVNITILHSVIDEGAGYGTGLHNWIIAIDGGGWCGSISECHDRSTNDYGSSRMMKPQVTFGGILHNHPKTNPDFYNWNRVRVRYCDGSSFTGDVEYVDPDNKLYFRGAKIFDAVMDNLLGKGMQNAENAILSGTSAGGLATILNCDKFKSLLPHATVKCVADAGFFINGMTIAGHSDIADLYDRVVTLHGSAKNLPPSCTSIMEPRRCFFPENAVSYVQTPLFIINSAYDSWQINNTLVPEYLDPRHVWDYCKGHISNCTYSQLIIIKGFGVEFLKTFEGLTPSYTRGYFITTCHSHGGIQLTRYWFSANSPRIFNKTIAEAVADWFFERTWIHQYIDSYPCARDCKLGL